MARFDGRPTRFDWTHVKGTDSKVVATFLDVSSVAVDLSGRTITAVAYAPGTVATAFALTTALSGVGNNVLTITVPDDATLPTELKADGTLDWALTVDFATGEVVSVVAGSFWIVNPGSPDSYSSSAAIDVTVSTAGPVAVTVTTLAAGPGLPTGGTTGQSLLKASNTNYDVVFGTASGTGDLLASANLSDVASAATSRTNLGLGTGDTPDLAITNMTLDDASLVVVDTTNLQTFADGVDHSLFKARGTGVNTTYVSTAAVGGTTFAQPEVFGEIKSDLGYFDVHYTGATGITVGNLAAASTYVYIDSANALQQQTTIPTRQDWSRKIFTMRIAVDVDTGLILGFEYLNNPLGNYANSTRDLYAYLLAQGVPFKIDQTITGRAGDLGFDVAAGSLLEYGGTGDIDNPNIKSLDAVANASYTLTSRTAFLSTETNLVKFWDDAGTITALGSTTLVGHRLYRFSNGNFVIQYGQGNYANMALAKAGVLTEAYVLNPALQNATFFGWWFIESTATNTGGTTLTDFVEYTIGVQGGSSAELSGALLKGNNLSDVLDAATALANLLGAPKANPTFTGTVNTAALTATGDVRVVGPGGSTARLLLDATTTNNPELYFDRGAGGANLKLFRVVLGGDGLYFQSRTDADGLKATPLVLGNGAAPVVDMTGATSVTVPDATGATHAVNRQTGDNRYDTVRAFMPADMTPADGAAATLTELFKRDVFTFAASANQAVVFSLNVPLHWTSINVHAQWVNFNDGSGDVTWRLDKKSDEVGDTISSVPSSGTSVTVTAGAENVITETLMLSDHSVTGGETLTFVLFRLGPGETVVPALLGVKVSKVAT
jgi:hypothetical protein